MDQTYMKEQTGIKIDRIDGTADGHFYDGEFTL